MPENRCVLSMHVHPSAQVLGPWVFFLPSRNGGLSCSFIFWHSSNYLFSTTCIGTSTLHLRTLRIIMFRITIFRSINRKNVNTIGDSGSYGLCRLTLALYALPGLVKPEASDLDLGASQFLIL